VVKEENETSSFVENILIILSNLPTGLRDPIVKNRLNEFLMFDKAEKKEIIQNILKNYDKINNEAILNLMQSWLNSLSEMRPDQINSMFYHYLVEISLKPKFLQNFDAELINSLSKILISFPQMKKDKLLNCFFEMILNIPNPKMFIKILPTSLLK